MNILADANIPYVNEAFDKLGRVRTLPGRSMTAADVRDADVLLVRSVTPVGPALLDGSRVRFVGTATIGTDHVDLDYLQRRNIAFASAAGSNARSVSEYVAAALFQLAARHGLTVSALTLGVVGVGNIGRLVVEWAAAAGMRVLQCDPPRARAEGADGFVDYARILREADVITFHVPLIRDGRDRTVHYVDAAALERTRPEALLINSSRGAVIDNGALKKALSSGRPGPVTLDVWENEPAIDLDLLHAVAIGTPHIAGYSFDGKVAGTMMLQHAVIDHFNAGAKWDPHPLLPRAPVTDLHVERQSGESDAHVISRTLAGIYDIAADDTAMRGALGEAPAAQRPAAFDALRRNYPVRREFTHTTLHLASNTAGLAPVFQALGFRAACASGRRTSDCDACAT